VTFATRAEDEPARLALASGEPPALPSTTIANDAFEAVTTSPARAPSLHPTSDAFSEAAVRA
jgi:hypothetical protein